MCKSAILNKTFGVELSEVSAVKEINTYGLDCLLKVVEGEAYLKAHTDTSDNDAYVISEGERIWVSGKVYVKAKTSVNICCAVFDRV